jgi:hypothetical protein
VDYPLLAQVEVILADIQEHSVYAFFVPIDLCLAMAKNSVKQTNFPVEVLSFTLLQIVSFDKFRAHGQ